MILPNDPPERVAWAPDPFYRVWLGLCIAYPLVVLVSIAATNILLSLIVLGWLRYGRRISTRPARLFLLLVGLYLAWTLLAVALSPIASHWSSWLEERSALLALLPGLVIGADRRRLATSLRWTSVLFLLLCGYAVYQYFFGWDLLRGKPLAFFLGRYHAISLQNFHLTFAGMICLILPILVGFWSERPWKASLFVFTGVVAVLSAMARSMMLALIGCGALFLLLGSGKLRRCGAFLLLILLILSSTIFYSGTGERFLRGVGIAEADSLKGDDTRIHLWKTSLAVIHDHPLTGIGQDNWSAIFDRYRDPYNHYSTTVGPHNDFLSTLVVNGAVGFFLFSLFWIYLLGRLARAVWLAQGSNRDLCLGLFAAFIMILVGGLFQDYQTDAENALLMWFLAGVAIQEAGNFQRNVQQIAR